MADQQESLSRVLEMLAAPSSSTGISAVVISDKDGAEIARAPTRPPGPEFQRSAELARDPRPLAYAFTNSSEQLAKLGVSCCSITATFRDTVLVQVHGKPSLVISMVGNNSSATCVAGMLQCAKGLRDGTSYLAEELQNV